MTDEADLVAEEAAADTGPGGAHSIASIQVRTKVHLYGVIASVTPGQAGLARGFQAVLTDASGHITLAWLGRHEISGIEVGTTMHICGRAVRFNQDLIIYNPLYTIEARRPTG